jgi:nicotinamide-nucleotide amidase
MISDKVIECSKAIAKKGWTITFVESASAGKMCYEFSRVPDSGKILIGGMVCYDANMKEEVLDIPPELIEIFTAESAEVTEAMAQNFCRIIASDVCVALTGLTGPGGSESREKPVGTIFLHIIFPHKQLAKRYEFKGNAEEIVSQAIDAAALLIIDEIIYFEKNENVNISKE